MSVVSVCAPCVVAIEGILPEDMADAHPDRSTDEVLDLVDRVANLDAATELEVFEDVQEFDPVTCGVCHVTGGEFGGEYRV